MTEKNHGIIIGDFTGKDSFMAIKNETCSQTMLVERIERAKIIIEKLKEIKWWKWFFERNRFKYLNSISNELETEETVAIFSGIIKSGSIRTKDIKK